ncbi:MAG TPA: ornithine cyclodeaminase family protein [Candidatus Limnocylindrales bacterium]|nr:ornithine cyclodeaminase family protein [Candidatus Limnocylindrales bacterium]
MALLLTEADVRSLLTMSVALDAVEDAFRRLADGSAQFHSRQRLHLPGNSYLHYMAGADGAGGYMGLKIYTSSRKGLRFLIPLFDAKQGELLALVEANYLGQMRTGAASGVATRLLARADARAAGIIGTGNQARTQLEAVTAVCKIESIRAFGRDSERRERFAREMTSRLGVRVEAVATAEEAVRDADILITASTASKPVVQGRWLRPGMHINAIGANFPEKAELDAEAVDRADVIFADSREQSKLEAGDLIQAFEGDYSRWNGVRELSDLVAGRVEGRTSREQVTLFKSNGIAIEDVVTAGRVYELAVAGGMGNRMQLFETDAAK